MKDSKTILSLLIIFFCIMPVCANDINGFEGNESLVQGVNSYRVNTFHDESGLLTVSIFSRKGGTEQGHWHDFRIDVAPDMVAIGGGAKAVLFPTGALLTASYPNKDRSAWLVSSKDHAHPQPHRLTGYAIGLKVNGMTRDELINSLYYRSSESGVEAHPEVSATIPNDYVLVSGGFKVNWTGYGNLATASFPETDFAWKARSKDHLEPSPANLMVWAIGLKRDLPVGEVMVTTGSSGSSPTAYPSSVATIPTGYVLTGAGAEVHWHGAGSLLWKLHPTTNNNQEVSAGAKDHMISVNSTITTYAVGIKIVPKF